MAGLPIPVLITDVPSVHPLYLQAAILTGLISRIVFIYPSWDTEQPAEEYERVDMQIGWYKPYVSNKTKELCMCEV